MAVYGAENVVTVRATVTAQFGGVATGTVTVADGVALCPVTLTLTSNNTGYVQPDPDRPARAPQPVRDHRDLRR